MVKLACGGMWLSCVTHMILSRGSGWDAGLLSHVTALLWEGKEREGVFFLDFSRAFQRTPFAGLLRMLLPGSKYTLRYLTNICKIQIRES